jgi:hypothetical protein
VRHKGLHRDNDFDAACVALHQVPNGLTWLSGKVLSMTAGARPDSGDSPDANPFDTSRPVQQSLSDLETLQVVQDHIGTGGSTTMTFRISPPRKAP